MMNMLLCLLLLQDWEGVRKEFYSDWQKGDVASRKAAIERLARHDRPESWDLLVKVIKFMEEEVQKLTSDKQRVQDDMKKYPADQIVDKAGKVIKPEWLKLRQDLDKRQRELEARISDYETLLDACAKVLGGHKNEKTVLEVSDAIRGEEKSAALRRICIKAAAFMKDTNTRGALLFALGKEKDPLLIVSIIYSLRQRKDPTTLAEILTKLESEYWQVALAVLEAVKQFDSPSAIEPLIERLKTADGRLKTQVNETLVLLTGEDKKGDYATWKDWWEQQKKDFDLTRPKKDERQKKYKAVKDGKADDGGTTFYGIPIKSKRLLFICDRSGSMAEKAAWQPKVETGIGDNDKPDGDRKIDICKYELRKAVRGLPEDAMFNIIFFNRDPIIFSESGPVKATPANKKKAIDWIHSFQPLGATNIFDTIEKGFTFWGPKNQQKNVLGMADTIFLLSDGLPTAGQWCDNTEKLIQEVQKMNDGCKVVINGIYVGSDKAGEEFMKKLAESSSGIFVKK